MKRVLFKLLLVPVLFSGSFAQESSDFPLDGAKLYDPSTGTVDIAIGGAEKGKSSDLFRMENVTFQIFGKDGRISSGCMPGSHWNGKQWNTPSPGERDGIQVGVVTKECQPLLNVPPENGGIVLPVAIRRGAWLACKTYGKMTLNLLKNGTGVWNITAGKEDAWAEETYELPVHALNIGPDGIWRGFRTVSWAHANTLIQSYNKGEIAYLAVLPASRVKLPEHTVSVEFLMLNRQGEKKLFQNPVPADASELAIVHLAPYAAQLVWKMPDGWSGGRVIRNTLKENSLTIMENSFRLNQKESKQ